MERPAAAAVDETGHVPRPVGADVRQAHHARLEAMFEAHHDVVWRTLRRYGLDPEAAADVAQQAFLVAIERIADIWQGSERAFLIGTGLRLARAARRKAARWQLEDQFEQHATHREGAEQRVAFLELADLVLASLPSDLVEVFILFDIEGCSAPEIAQALELPIGTVSSRLRRGREEFRVLSRRLELMFKREVGGP
jgi:RNA polymerase sigma-70 factor (ECF subfamily)